MTMVEKKKYAFNRWLRVSCLQRPPPPRGEGAALEEDDIVLDLDLQMLPLREKVSSMFRGGCNIQSHFQIRVSRPFGSKGTFMFFLFCLETYVRSYTYISFVCCERNLIM